MKAPSRLSLALAAAIGLAFPLTSRAAAQVWDGCCGSHLLSDFAATARVYQELTDDRINGISGNYRAGASSNQGAGTVGGFIEAIRTDPPWLFGPLEVHSWASVGDFVTIHGPAGGPVPVEFTFDIRGRFELTDLGGLYANSTFYVGGRSVYFNILWGGGPAEPTALYNTNARATGIDMSPLSLAATLHLTAMLSDGDEVSVGALLELRAQPTAHQWATVDFGHTGSLGVALPEGYSFTSRSGVFLTEPHGVPAPVAEPAPWVLLMAATVAAALAAQRRPPTCESPNVMHRTEARPSRSTP